MNPQKTIVPLLTPILGMLPVAAFLISDCFFSYHTALMVALVTYTLYFLAGVIGLKYEPPYTLLVSTISFLILMGLSAIKPFNLLYITQSSIVLELILVPLFYLFIRIQGYFRAKIVQKDGLAQEFRLLKFDADLSVIKTAVFVLSTHLLIVLVYQLFPPEYHTPDWDRAIYYEILFLFILFHFIYEIVHWNCLKKQILDEEWLPIVNESGAVRGKVALSVSQTVADKYLHPVVRIVLIHKGMLFLKKKPDATDQGRWHLDYPFERHLRFKETLDEGVKEAFVENGGSPDLPYSFIFRYVYKKANTNRLIYLYACNIPDEKIIDGMNLGEGKWWTGKQIDENLGTELFSTYFEKEYELLNTTVLMADRLMRNLDENV
ncbi:MAG: hypothetical protein LBO74_16425 [Candidatus Symbiothrix sp.]|jgi:hypothetical protein|nr:hypothetical protein [Candidatus Symbiothrix sp.]